MIKGEKHMNPFRHAWKHPIAHCMSTTIPKLYGSYVGQHWVQKNSLNHDSFPFFNFFYDELVCLLEIEDNIPDTVSLWKLPM